MKEEITEEELRELKLLAGRGKAYFDSLNSLYYSLDKDDIDIVILKKLKRTMNISLPQTANFYYSVLHILSSGAKVRRKSNK